MRPVLFLIILFGTYLLQSEPANAKVYKWVDKNGKVHYSDKPPAHLENKKALNILGTEEKKSTASVKVPEAKIFKAIDNPDPSNAKRVILEHVSIALENKELGHNPAIGVNYNYSKKSEITARQIGNNKNNKTPLNCVDDGKLTLKNANYILKNTNLAPAFSQTINKHGYKTISTNKKFALQQNEQTELSLAAVITNISLAHCGSKYSTNLKDYTQNSTYLKVSWELFDNLRREVIFSATTEGSDHHFAKAPRLNGATVSLSNAFQNALESLMSNQGFSARLLHNSDRPAVKQTSQQISETLELAIQIGSKGTEFVANVPNIKKASVTIRTASGHGSGFIISDKGYILTNHHVVGYSRELLVLIDGKEFPAEIVRNSPERDVALLRITGDYPKTSLALSNNKTTIGETIYVVGTPLSEELDFTVTRGIISAKRQYSNQPYYQTDATVNPGNSGGPVFNKYGNVIAITVSGLVTKEGNTTNINYLIPIDDALNVLGIKFP